MSSVNDIPLAFRSPGLRDLSPTEKMQFAVDLGVKYIEPQCAPHEVADVAYATAMGEAAAAAGININSCGCVLELSDPSQNYLDRIQFAIDACKAMNCGYVFSTIFNPSEQEPQQVTWDRIIPRCREAVHMLDDNGIKLGIEPDSNNFIDAAERMEDLLDAVNDDRLYVNFDACNFYINGSNPLRALKTFAGRIFSGHIKDGWYYGRNGSECPVGEGEVPWHDLLTAMDEMGLHCPMHVEHCNSVEKVTAAINHIRSVQAQLLEPAM